ncbi:MAG: MotA/TolQ/ExbB proton channel family protein [Catalinimonas sp.]
MRKLFTLTLIACFVALGAPLNAQDPIENTAQSVEAGMDSAAAETEQAVESTAAAVEEEVDEALPEEAGFHHVIKEKFIQGDVLFMTPVLVVLILGLAVAIERIISLNLATTNSKKLLARVEDALSTGGVDAALDVTRKTRGPVASIFTQGLMRYTEGIEMVEKSIISYGSVEMGRLERGLVWLSLFIALAPNLGFLGTVIGMIQAFDAIASAGDVSPGLVASGIQVALITTVSGLIVAIILQIFYNYCVSKIDSMVNDMEDASISLVDLLVRHKLHGGTSTGGATIVDASDRTRV